MRRVLDAIVVGAGCSGLPAAVTLTNSGASFTLLDAGPRVLARRRFDDFESANGVGGAGLFSDGKFSFFPASQRMFGELSDVPVLQQSYDRCISVLQSHGMPCPPFPDTNGTDYKVNSWTFKRYPSYYMGLAERLALTAQYERQVDPALVCYATVHDVALQPSGNYFVHTTDEFGVASVLETRTVILSGGRFLPAAGFPSLPSQIFRRFEYGARFEVPGRLFSAQDGIDPKYVYDNGHGVQWRTFCSCYNGEVVQTRSRVPPLVTLSGRADCPPSGTSNMGFNVRITDPQLAQRVAPAILSAATAGRTFRVPVLSATASSLSEFYGPEGAQLLVDGLERFYELFPDVRNRRADAWLRGVTIEGVSNYWNVDGGLTLAKEGHPRVFVTGDATGLFRGIVAAMVSGYYAATRLVRTL